MSKNAIGLIILLLSLWGLDVPEAMVNDAVAGIGAVISLVLLVWNQFGRPDVKHFFIKK